MHSLSHSLYASHPMPSSTHNSLLPIARVTRLNPPSQDWPHLLLPPSPLLGRNSCDWGWGSAGWLLLLSLRCTYTHTGSTKAGISGSSTWAEIVIDMATKDEVCI